MFPAPGLALASTAHVYPEIVSGQAVVGVAERVVPGILDPHARRAPGGGMTTDISASQGGNREESRRHRGGRLHRRRTSASACCAEGYEVVGVDDLSYGSMANLASCLAHPGFRFEVLDCTQSRKLRVAFDGCDAIAHLAAKKIPRYGGALSRRSRSTSPACMPPARSRSRSAPT